MTKIMNFIIPHHHHRQTKYYQNILCRDTIQCNTKYVFIINTPKYLYNIA